MNLPITTITPDNLLSLQAYAKIRGSSKPAAIVHRRLRCAMNSGLLLLRIFE